MVRKKRGEGGKDKAFIYNDQNDQNDHKERKVSFNNKNVVGFVFTFFPCQSLSFLSFLTRKRDSSPLFWTKKREKGGKDGNIHLYNDH